MKRYYKFIVESADRKIDYFTDNQVMNEDRPDYGSIKSAFIDVKMTVYIACTGVAAYLNPKVNIITANCFQKTFCCI